MNKVNRVGRKPTEFVLKRIKNPKVLRPISKQYARLQVTNRTKKNQRNSFRIVVPYWWAEYHGLDEYDGINFFLGEDGALILYPAKNLFERFSYDNK